MRQFRKQGASVIEFSTFKPNPLAPTVMVDQLLGFYRIGPLVQLTYGCEAIMGAGAFEPVQACNLLWQPQKLIQARELFGWAITEWRDGTFKDMRPEDVGFRRPRSQ